MGVSHSLYMINNLATLYAVDTLVKLVNVLSLKLFLIKLFSVTSMNLGVVL